MSARHTASPLAAPLWTPGVLVLVALMIPGLAFIVARFVGGLGAVTNLCQTSPWGIWVAIDVATGVALAAGGFTTAALAHVFGRKAYETTTRPALLTAMLGYTSVPVALELVNVTDYIGFGSLGYKGNPIVHGGRFKKLPLGQGPSLPNNPQSSRPVTFQAPGLVKFDVVDRREVSGLYRTHVEGRPNGCFWESLGTEVPDPSTGTFEQDFPEST